MLVTLFSGMSVCDDSEKILPQNKFHTLLLSGKYLDVEKVLIKC